MSINLEKDPEYLEYMDEMKKKRELLAIQMGITYDEYMVELIEALSFCEQEKE
jgi:hypothetical protein